MVFPVHAARRLGLGRGAAGGAESTRIGTGQPRKLLLHANRNGFFYVLDRTNGKLLLAQPFVKKITWAKEIAADGRPVLNPNQIPTKEGNMTCPAVEGATNWFSTSFNPATGLYYLQTLEKCNIYVKSEINWEAGKAFFRGSDARGSERQSAEGAEGDRYSHGENCVGAAAERGARNRGVGRSRHRPAWCFSARIAARSWRWMRRTEKCCGIFSSTPIGRRRR